MPRPESGERPKPSKQPPDLSPVSAADWSAARLAKTLIGHTVQDLHQAGLIGADLWRHSAVLVLFVRLAGEWQILFQKRAEGIPQAGEIAFPGGTFDVDSDADLCRTALRETEEEMGIAEDQIQVWGRFGSLTNPRGLLVDVWVGELANAGLAAMQPNSSEVAASFTLPLTFFLRNPAERYATRMEMQTTREHDGQTEVLLPARELGFPERYHQTWGGFLRPVWVWRTNHGPLWGMTAEIVRAMAGCLSAEG